MPHLLMSNQPLDSGMPPSQPSAESKVLEFRRPGDSSRTVPAKTREEQHDLEPLRLQVTSIIDEILAETGSADAEVRDRLRRHVAENPGQPEKALLKHLLMASIAQDESA